MDKKSRVAEAHLRFNKTLSLLQLSLVGCTYQHAVESQSLTIDEPATHSHGLLSPHAYGKSLTAQQLLTVKHEGQVHRVRTLLQVDAKQVRLVGVSTLSVPLFEVQWDGEVLVANAIGGMNNDHLQPVNVMSDIMLSLWPQYTLAPLLHEKNWHVNNDHHRREFVAQNGKVVMTIDYLEHKKANGIISVSYPQYDVNYELKTLQWKESSD